MEEEENISRLIISINQALKGKKYNILVVDDESKDKTQRVVLDLIEKDYPVYLVSRKKKGVFSAQMDGAKLASGKIIVFLDADFSHPPEKIPEMLEYIPKYDFVSGSRFINGSKIIAPFPRKFSTISLNMFIRLLLGWEVTDYTGIFHAIKKDKWDQIKLKYDAVWGESGMEIFKEAKRLGLAIKEVPFTYDYRKEGKSKSDNLLKYAWTYFKRAFQVKFMRWVK